MPLNLSINYAKTPKEYSKKGNTNRSDDRLNLSVEVSQKRENRNIQENSVRLSKITEEKLNLSVNDVSSRKDDFD